LLLHSERRPKVILTLGSTANLSNLKRSALNKFNWQNPSQAKPEVSQNAQSIIHLGYGVQWQRTFFCRSGDAFSAMILASQSEFWRKIFKKKKRKFPLSTLIQP